MKVAHLSDLHIDERGHLEDVENVLSTFGQEVERDGVDLVLLAGDFFDRRSTPKERAVFGRFLRHVAHFAPVFGVKGNHDAPLDLHIFNFQETAWPVLLMEDPTLRPGSGQEWAVRQHGLTSTRRVGLLALPWFDKAHLVSQMPVSATMDQTREATIAAANDVLACLRAEAARLRKEGAVPILVSHLMVGGSEVSSGQTLIGTSVELSPADLASVGAEYVALGHVHKTQEWYGGRVCYSGSPVRTDYGEKEAKGWRLVTFDEQGRFVSNEFRELPAQKIVLIEKDWTDGTITLGTAPELRSAAGARVRFRYHVRPQDLSRVNENEIRSFLKDVGAAEVKLEAIVEQEARARAPEIITKESLSDKVFSYLQAKDVRVEPAQEDRLRAKVSLLEGV